MRSFNVASQMGPAFDTAFGEALPCARITPIPLGVPCALPNDIEVLFARSFSRPGTPAPVRPDGWPFGVKWVQLLAVGADLFPDWIFDGPIVSSGRGWSANALAEFALAMIFASAKRIPDVWISGADEWRPVPMDSVSGANLGLFGFGSIGRALAPKARAVGMNVASVRRTDAALPSDVVRLRDIDDLFAWSDHLVLAAPATSETHHVVNDRSLNHAKAGLHLINIARGALVDENALLRALDADRIARATLDTTDAEPPPRTHRFYSHPKVRLSAHTAVFTSDAPARQLEKFVRNATRYALGQPLEDSIDRTRGY